MNYEWNNVLSEGQEMVGYTDVYDTQANSIKLRIIISYFPDLNQLNNNKICNVTFFYCGKKDELTSGVFHMISDDITKLIQNDENVKFKASMNEFDFMMTQHFFVKEIPDLKFYSHGTYTV